MQNWMFVNEFDFWTLERAKSILTSVPIVSLKLFATRSYSNALFKGKMIVLDLQSERSPQYQNLEQYFGQPFIWCMLHNFGGTLGMFGSSTMVNYVKERLRTFN